MFVCFLSLSSAHKIHYLLEFLNLFELSRANHNVSHMDTWHREWKRLHGVIFHIYWIYWKHQLNKKQPEKQSNKPQPQQHAQWVKRRDHTLTSPGRFWCRIMYGSEPWSWFVVVQPSVSVVKFRLKEQSDPPALCPLGGITKILSLNRDTNTQYHALHSTDIIWFWYIFNIYLS